MSSEETQVILDPRRIYLPLSSNSSNEVYRRRSEAEVRTDLSKKGYDATNSDKYKFPII